MKIMLPPCFLFIKILDFGNLLAILAGILFFLPRPPFKEELHSLVRKSEKVPLSGGFVGMAGFALQDFHIFLGVSLIFPPILLYRRATSSGKKFKKLLYRQVKKKWIFLLENDQPFKKLLNQPFIIIWIIIIITNIIFASNGKPNA